MLCADPASTSTMSITRPIIAITGETLDRDRVAQRLPEDASLVFADCDFSGGDLSRLNLQETRLRHCVLAGTSFDAATLARIRWQRRRAGHADFESGNAVDARFASRA